jgi:hypothetical protein
MESCYARRKCLEACGGHFEGISDCTHLQLYTFAPPIMLFFFSIAVTDVQVLRKMVVAHQFSSLHHQWEGSWGFAPYSVCHWTTQTHCSQPHSVMDGHIRAIIALKVELAAKSPFFLILFRPLEMDLEHHAIAIVLSSIRWVCSNSVASFLFGQVASKVCFYKQLPNFRRGSSARSLMFCESYL